jgi:opacity protein-like surface antigen
MNLKMLLAVLLVSASIPVYSQVVPEAKAPGIPLTVGVGYSNYATDWSGRLSGPMLWADWNFYDYQSFLRGFGLEVEARDLNYDRTGETPNLRMDTASGGVIYSLHPYRHRFKPYAKFLIGYGSIDFNVAADPYYKHDTRTVYTPAGGLDYRLFGDVWVRGDYEYQFWTDFFDHHALNPNGVTVGIAYDLKSLHHH